MRNYKGKNIELLAPAGNFKIFEGVVASACDAIYLGGQAFNMRMIRKGFNFSNDELVQASKLAHSRGKKLYITVNNLIEEAQLEPLKAYLCFLHEKVKPDALIVQDMAVLKLVKELGLGLDLHSSVMMNVHNLDMIECLEKEGVSRVVLSREMSLKEVRRLGEKTRVELEYFTHGDMCITHGSQCYYSSLLFGMSSNRGRCLKPCRWWFDTDDKQQADGHAFPLAVKDLSLYQHLPEMLEAGVNTFKIEGRMREKAFITDLVNLYGNALDTYIENPDAYDASAGYAHIEKTKKRDLSVGYAFGNPGEKNLNTRHEGTGKFYSTGKMFSTPTAEKDSDATDQVKIEKALVKYQVEAQHPQKISVKVQNMDQARTAIELGVDRVYLSGDIYRPAQPFTADQARALKNSMQADQALYLATPRMMNETQASAFRKKLVAFDNAVDGILVTQMGLLNYDSTHPLAGDYSLNIYNSAAKKWYEERGLNMATASIEMNADQLGALSKSVEGLEVIVYGRLTSMYFDHDFFKALGTQEDICELKNEAGTYQIFKDQFEKTHLLTTHTLNLLPIMKTLRRLNIDMFRVEAQCMSKAELTEVITALKTGQPYHTEKQTFGALRF